jgi:hypothetical protein
MYVAYVLIMKAYRSLLISLQGLAAAPRFPGEKDNLRLITEACVVNLQEKIFVDYICDGVPVVLLAKSR